MKNEKALAMIIVIDGYNLLKQIYSQHKKALERHRTHFIQRLADYKALRQGAIKDVIVVFDAGPFFHATREVKQGIVTIFSGQKSSADDWIMRYIDRQQGQEVMIVTNDRAIVYYAQQHGAQTIDVQAFHRLMTDVITQAATKRTNQRNSGAPSRIAQDDILSDQLVNYAAPVLQDELDVMMEDASGGVQDDSMPAAPQRAYKGSATMLSKKERKNKAYLKKLK